MKLPVARPGAVLAALGLLVAATDFFGRVYVGRDSSLRDFTPPPAVTLPAERDPALVRAEVASWIPALPGNVQAPTDPNSPDAWDLALKGIFRERSRTFAVIMAKPRQGGTPPVAHRLTVGDDLHGYKVAAIEAGTVTLAGSSGQRELRLFSTHPGPGPQ